VRRKHDGRKKKLEPYKVGSYDCEWFVYVFALKWVFIESYYATMR
jgi:hypothetical protein